MFIMRFLHISEIIKKNFLQELRDANAGKPTSLRFIKQNFPLLKPIKPLETFQVLVIGGTILKKALIKKDGHLTEIIDYHEKEHPLLLTKDQFFNYLHDNLYDSVNIAAINFAYPINPILRNGKMDGILLSGGKGNLLNGLEGVMVGKNLEDHLLNKYQRKMRVFVVNDVICLLASLPQDQPKEKIIGAIMGTGTNLSFYEKDYAVNIQSGGFDKFSPSNECIEIDKDSPRPGKSLFEKETAGAYLYKQFNYLVVKNKINYSLINSTKELYESVLNDKNTEVKTLAHMLFEKSAAYFASQTAGLAFFKNEPINVIMEGSLYWENPFYRELFSDYLKILSPKFEIKILKVDNSSIIGAANLLT